MLFLCISVILLALLNIVNVIRINKLESVCKALVNNKIKVIFEDIEKILNGEKQ